MFLLRNFNSFATIRRGSTETPAYVVPIFEPLSMSLAAETVWAHVDWPLLLSRIDCFLVAGLEFVMKSRRNRRQFGQM